jgi:hypothetical protein
VSIHELQQLFHGSNGMDLLQLLVHCG